MPQSTNRLKVAGAFAAIYVLWGGTYLAIAIGLQSLPAFLLIASRSLIGGCVLLIIAYARTSALCSLRDWGHAAIGGVFLFVGCHGALAYAQREIPSGLSAVILATIPFWIVLINLAVARAEPFSKLLGLAPGFAGVALIAWHETSRNDHPLSLAMIFLLLGSALSWAIGTVYSQRRSAHIPSDHLAAMQLLCGGLGLLILSGSVGELATFSIEKVTAASVAGMLYLALLGSVVGNTAYLWLLDRMSAPLVATYTFVNPVIALVLGWWVLREPISWLSFGGSALIVGSIISLLLLPSRRPLRAAQDVSV
ncbi:MAG: EamA family transporter [Alphaproteobacteria bacterium]|nr:EamA family transporter [Alphaproteobacteria bacterium]MBV8407254.1 EamA family transporter [Alphaproteobacteria bacterium]